MRSCWKWSNARTPMVMERLALKSSFPSWLRRPSLNRITELLVYINNNKPFVSRIGCCELAIVRIYASYNYFETTNTLFFSVSRSHTHEVKSFSRNNQLQRKRKPPKKVKFFGNEVMQTTTLRGLTEVSNDRRSCRSKPRSKPFSSVEDRGGDLRTKTVFPETYQCFWRRSFCVEPAV